MNAKPHKIVVSYQKPGWIRKDRLKTFSAIDNCFHYENEKRIMMLIYKLSVENTEDTIAFSFKNDKVTVMVKDRNYALKVAKLFRNLRVGMNPAKRMNAKVVT